MKMQKWVIQIELQVSNVWVADGFDAEQYEEEISESITGLLPYAYGHEVKAKVKFIQSPDKAVIRKIQGYKD